MLLRTALEIFITFRLLQNYCFTPTMFRLMLHLLKSGLFFYSLGGHFFWWTFHMPACAVFGLERANFGFGRANFLHSTGYGTVLWFHAGHSADYTGMFWLFLSCVCTESGPPLFLTHPTSEEVGVHKMLCGHSRDSWAQLPTGTSQTIWNVWLSVER